VLVVDGKTYRVASTGENARTAKTMHDMIQTIITSRQAVGKSNEGVMSQTLAKQLAKFVSVFEIVGVQ